MANEWRQIVTLIALSATLIDAFSGDRHARLRRPLSPDRADGFKEIPEIRERSFGGSKVPFKVERARIGHRTR